MIQPTASAWLAALDFDASAWRNALDALYGPAGMPPESGAMLRAALHGFIARFGDGAARVFRAPGRVNLRGMHVDTHGGYLNLMSHQREMIVAFGPEAPGRYSLVNAASAYADAAFETAPLRDIAIASGSWEKFLASAPARDAATPRGQWGHYALGAALRAEFAAGGAPLFGLRACVTGNIPAGGGLSSSAALCVALYGAIAAQNGLDNPPADWIMAARDAEWFSGARTGTSDQAACVLCRPNEITNIALLAEDFSLDTLRRVPFPNDLRLLVINSCTRRSLSGKDQVAYSKNRFAYSMALDVFRQEWARMTGDPTAAAHLDRLSRIHSDTPAARDQLYAVLERVPAQASLADLRARYDLPALDDQYDRYFGNADEVHRPTAFNLLGPLVFGIAESERARLFADWIVSGNIDAAAKAMHTGHNGDRVCARGNASDRRVTIETVRDANSSGITNATLAGYHSASNAFDRSVTIDSLRAAKSKGLPIFALSGDYGASSPALDALVDAAEGAGAVAACLTGAGIAGCVLALCKEDDILRVTHAIHKRLRSAYYPVLARREAPLLETELADAITTNAPPAGACELPWPP